MKVNIEAYNEQKRISQTINNKESHYFKSLGINGKSLTDAVIFGKNDSSLFMSGIEYGEKSKEADKNKMSATEQIKSEAELVSSNLKAIFNKMDMGEMVRISEEGVDINEIEVSHVVTVGEQIRIKMAAAGNQHVYTGDISEADLKAVLGDEFARKVADNLAKYNLPISEDNIYEVTNALERAKNLTQPDINAISYICSNDLEPTIDNLYKAEHAGDFTKVNKLSEQDWEKLLPQVEEMLVNSGLYEELSTYNTDLSAGDKQNTSESADMNDFKELVLNDFRSLIEGGVLINDNTIDKYFKVLEAAQLIKLNNNADSAAKSEFEDIVIDKAVASMIDLSEAKDTDLSDEPVTWQKAKETMSILENLTIETIERVFNQSADDTKSELITLNKLADIQQNLNDIRLTQWQGCENLNNVSDIKGYRKLQELRLLMTFESAYVCEKNGIDVNNTDIYKLVDELYKIESHAAEYNNAINDYESEKNRVHDFFEHSNELEDAMNMLKRIGGSPCDVLGPVSQEDEVTFSEIEKAAQIKKAEYDNANKAYETMSTQIRTDLGDKVSKAVAASTDNVLKELNQDINEENRRAVRILAYNDMEVTVERITKVKEIDKIVNNIFEKMTPDIALELLRDHADIMGMDIRELSKTLDKKKDEKDERVTCNFAQYLHGLDKKGMISESDRESYMALYSIVNKLVKDDSNAIGQLVNQDNEETLGNLVTAYMTRKDKGMDVIIGNIDADAQTGQNNYEQSASGNNAKLAYYKNMLSELAKIPQEAVSMVTDNVTATIDNLTAAGALVNDSAVVYKEIKDRKIQDSLEKFLDSCDNKDRLIELYDELNEEVKKYFNEVENDESIIDFAALKQLSNGMNLIQSMAKNNTFYIPYDKDNETAAIKLSVYENTDIAGSFTIDMENDSFGKLQISGKVENDELTAYIVFSKESESADISENIEGVKNVLIKEGFGKVKINSSKAGEMPKARQSKTGNTTVKKLFSAAKVFVEGFR